MDQLIRAFDVQPSAERWRMTRPEAVTVVRLQARPNSAAGPTPWGPAGDPVRDPRNGGPTDSRPLRSWRRRRWSSARTSTATRSPGTPSTGSAPSMQLVLVVDMGWPSPDRRYADVATFGASALMGRALLHFLFLTPQRPHKWSLERPLVRT